MLPQKILGIFHMYGLMIAVGILACFGVLFHYGKKKKVESKFIDFIFYVAIAAIVLGFGSAALFQAVYDYIENPAAGFKFGGITFLGGLIGGAATFLVLYFIFRKKYKTRLIDVLSFLPCCILVAHAFGRVGCFFAGCCYGKPTDCFLGIRFPGMSQKVHPTQLYEALFLFALFAVNYLLVWKKDFKHGMSLYLIAYGVFRFCLEFLRDDHRGSLVAGLTPSQFWSIGMVVLGVALVFILSWMRKRRAAQIAAEAGEAPTEEIEQAQATEVEQ